MASSCLQICALLLALAGFTTLVVTTMSSRWKVLDTTAELVTAGWVSEGLWMDCAATALGSVECKKILYMLNSDCKWSRHMLINSEAGGLFLLSGQCVSRLGGTEGSCPRGSSVAKSCSGCRQVQGPPWNRCSPCSSAQSLLWLCCPLWCVDIEVWVTYSKSENFLKNSFGRNSIFSLSLVLQYKQITNPWALVFVCALVWDRNY